MLEVKNLSISCILEIWESDCVNCHKANGNSQLQCALHVGHLSPQCFLMRISSHIIIRYQQGYLSQLHCWLYIHLLKTKQNQKFGQREIICVSYIKLYVKYLLCVNLVNSEQRKKLTSCCKKYKEHRLLWLATQTEGQLTLSSTKLTR